MIQRATNLFALWTTLGTLWTWLMPEHFVWTADGSVRPFGQPLIGVLLGVIMLGMGLAPGLAVGLVLREGRVRVMHRRGT